VAEMSDDEKAHFATLDDVAKRGFVSLSSDDRAEEIEDVTKAANDADPVVYKSADGTEIRTSDGPAVLALTKRADRAEKRAEAAEAKASDIDVRKRASDDLASLPGSLDERTALLKAVESIVDDGERDAALAALKAGNTALAKGFENRGTSFEDIDAGSAEGQLDALAKRYVESHDDVSEAVAYTKVLETTEGRRLYSEMDQQ
jgi:hypothetical protein